RCSTTIFFTRSAVSLIGVRNLSLVRRGVWARGRALPLERSRANALVTHIGPKPPQRIKSLFLLLNHRHAAVDVKRLAGDVSGLVARKVNDGGGDLVRFAHTTGGNSPKQCGLLSVVESV